MIRVKPSNLNRKVALFKVNAQTARFEPIDMNIQKPSQCNKS